MTDLALVLLCIAILAALAWLVGRGVAAGRRAEAQLIRDVDVCFASLASRFGLSMERPPPYDHPVLGSVASMPSVSGDVDGVRVSLRVEMDGARDQWTTVATFAPSAGSTPWQRFDVERLSAEARAAWDALRRVSREVAIERGGLRVLPDTPRRVDFTGGVKWVETDGARLNALVESALDFSRTLRDQR